MKPLTDRRAAERDVRQALESDRERKPAQQAGGNARPALAIRPRGRGHDP